MKTPAIAVLDVGKTNKKVTLYDRGFQMLAAERCAIETRDWNGIEVEDTDRLLTWFRGALKTLAAEHAIRAVAITAHGATFTLLNEAGELALPVISYTCARGAEVQEEFYEVFGSKEDLHRKTGTPDIGFCNMAKVLYFVKTRLPESWAQCKHGLFYGPFLGHALTGKRGLEPTFPGNHTYFWDYEAQSWSDVGRQLGADRLFGEPMSKSWDSLGVVKPELVVECGLPADCKVTLGIHDSNANYLPYLAKGYDDFLLNSTGTWAVMMRSAEAPRLSEEEIAAKVFFNQDAFGRPVRTSLITLGMDYDTLSRFSALKDRPDVDAARSVVAERQLFVVPGVIESATAFPGVAPRVVQGDREHFLDALERDGGTPFTGLGAKYFEALNLGLALATAKMLANCGIVEGTTIFIEGGFAKNASYCEFLAALCPQQRFALTNVPEGTSFGAAITGWMLAEGKALEDIGKEFEIEAIPVKPRDLDGLDAYRAAFEAACRR